MTEQKVRYLVYDHDYDQVEFMKIFDHRCIAENYVRQTGIGIIEEIDCEHDFSKPLHYCGSTNNMPGEEHFRINISGRSYLLEDMPEDSIDLMIHDAIIRSSFYNIRAMNVEQAIAKVSALLIDKVNNENNTSNKL